MDSGNTAWMLTSAALVFLMTPGVAFFYGGMVRAKAVLNMDAVGLVDRIRRQQHRRHFR